MTLKEISENQEFLILFIKSSQSRAKTFVHQINKAEFACIIELIINLKNVSINETESEVVTNSLDVISFFESKNAESLESVRKFTLTNIKQIKGIIAYMLNKILEEAILCVCDYSENGRLDNTCNWISFHERFDWQNYG